MPADHADLADLAAAGHTAVLTMELQRGVVGDLSPIEALVQAVRESGTVTQASRLVAAARAAGVPVVHCTYEARPDGAGSAVNAPMLAALARARGGREGVVQGSDAAALVPELGPEPSDLTSARLHGVSPFTGTELDATLRNLGVATVVATGVSVNLGVLGLAIEAVNLGYRVVLATDAVTGTPADYADAVVANTLSLLATRATVDDIVAVWA